MTFIDFDVCNLAVPFIACVVLRDLDLFFKVKYVKCKYLENGDSWRKMHKHDVYTG